jgi:hypothetical protein
MARVKDGALQGLGYAGGESLTIEEEFRCGGWPGWRVTGAVVGDAGSMD